MYLRYRASDNFWTPNLPCASPLKQWMAWGITLDADPEMAIPSVLNREVEAECISLVGITNRLVAQFSNETLDRAYEAVC